MRYGIIDIGSNSIRFMEEGKVKKLVITTRLGEGLAETGRLAESSMARSVSVIKALVSDSVHRGLIPYAYATSAVRDAENQKEFLERVRESCGIDIDVLSGEREAEYAFRAAAKEDGGLIDIGGASFQLVTEGFTRSIRLGCVRGRDIAQTATNAASCDENWDAQRRVITEIVSTRIALPKILIRSWTGVRGTVATLAAFKAGRGEYDIKTVDSVILTRSDVEELIEKLHGLGEARKLEPILNKRHDVIMYGAAILAAVMDTAGIERIAVSSRDGMEGYLDYLKNG